MLSQHDLSKYYLFFTSNVAADIFQGNENLSLARKVEAAINDLKRRFKSPEFIARFGKFGYGIFAFKALSPDSLRLIARKFIRDECARFKTIHQKANDPDNMIVKGVSAVFVEKALRQINSNKNGAREIRDVIERMINRAYDNTFPQEKIGNPQTGYLDIINQEPVLTQEKPERCRELD